MTTSAHLNEAQLLMVQTLLRNFAATNAEAKLLLLTSEDGFELVAHPASSDRTTRIAAMSSSIQALSDSLIHEVGLTRSNSLIVESDAGAIVVIGVRGVTPRMSLAVFTNGNQLLGKLLWAARELAKQISVVLRR